MICLILCCVLGLIPAVIGEEHEQCKPWKNIEDKLKETVLQINCTHTSTCSGMSCFLEKYGYEIRSGIHMNPCENPSSIEVEVDIPKLNINQWKRKFYHGDIFSLNDNLGGKLDLQKDKNSFILGLSLEIHSNSPSSPLLHLIPTILPSMQYPVFHNVVFPMPSCSVSTKSTSSAPLIIKNISATSSPLTHSPLLLNTAAETYMNCSIRLSTCPEHELCQQIDKSKPAGTCVCMPDYVRDKSGKCIYSPSVSTTTETPGGDVHPNHGTSNTSLLLTAILVPITVILLILGIVYGTIRFRICQHLRRRLRVQVYEQVLLGQDDDLEDDSSNPVA
ncbi:hypothetical protein AVEN_129790-1 [Araneus ventricosus]|uniref:EGF-like domain-containing protein n=1 Tax=Araneus ventricosus TaxID=182803 RepID=A0A4Y2FPD3_ARAVE|nr:hypothetical protein AVEN_129790-1 [Araneus ventricosus]